MSDLSRRSRISGPFSATEAPAGDAATAQQLSATRRRKRAPTPLGADVARELERLILAGELEPGERLNEVALARRLGVSRGPVREAARALEKSGLVTVIMNRGAFVRQLDLNEAMAIYELNAVLFGFAAGQVAETLNAERALALSRMVDEMDRAIGADDRDGFFALNVRFHTEIMAASPNRQVEAVYQSYTRKLLLLRRRSFEPGRHMQQANAEHRGIVEAILAGDGTLARCRAEAHARFGRARFLESIGRANGQPEAEVQR
jgi:DNA-binding GntR family transcriptional regulator